MAVSLHPEPLIEVTKSRRNPLIFLRGQVARKAMWKLRRKLKRLFDNWNREAADRVLREQPPIPADYTTRWTDELIRKQVNDLYLMSSAGIKLAQMEFEGQKAFDDPIVMIGTKPTDFLLEDAKVDVDGWLRDISSPTTRRHAAKINQVHREALDFRDDKGRGLTPLEQSKRIKKLDSTYDDNRARMIAFTNTNWAMNAGVKATYRSRGVTLIQWLTTKDEAVCPFCKTMDKVIVRINDPFWKAGDTMGVVVDKNNKPIKGATEAREHQKLRKYKFKLDVGHPPLHPFCACTLVPVLKQIKGPETPLPESVEVPAPTKPKPAKPKAPRFREIKKEGSQQAYITKHGLKFGKTLSRPEIEAMNKYFVSAEINKLLRKGISTLDSQELKQLAGMSSAIKKTKLPDNLLLFRGTENFELDKLLKKNGTLDGTVFHDKAFSSTSLSQETANSFSRMVAAREDLTSYQMTIRTPKGTKVGYPSLGGKGKFDDEVEILLDRNVKMKVLKTEIDDSDPDIRIVDLLIELVD